jgi:hypothetical protein
MCRDKRITLSLALHNRARCRDERVHLNLKAHLSDPSHPRDDDREKRTSRYLQNELCNSIQLARASTVRNRKTGQLRDTYACFGWFSHCYREVGFRRRKRCKRATRSHGDCSGLRAGEKSVEIVSRGFLMISRHLHFSARNETLLASLRLSTMRLSAAPADVSRKSHQRKWNIRPSPKLEKRCSLRCDLFP